MQSIVVWRPPRDHIANMDVLSYLWQLPDNSVHTVVTSPPYWGMRDYATDGQIGSEPSLDAHIATMVGVFREVRRVLRSDGTLWLNYGDSYASTPNGRSAAATKAAGADNRTFRDKPFSTVQGKLKQKDLIGLPWRVALALQDDGWWLRSDIIWHKPNAKPDSAKDRPSLAHEYVFLLAKSPQYFYDRDAIAEPTARAYKATPGYSGFANRQQNKHATIGRQGKGPGALPNPTGMRNRRTVWTVATEPFKDAHFATFPTKLIEPMILAGCPPKVCSACGAPYRRLVDRTFILQPDVSAERGVIGAEGQKTGDPNSRDFLAGWSGTPRGTVEARTTGWEPTCSCNAPMESGVVLDPFMGSGTTALVARRTGRHYMGCELNPDYLALADKRLAQAKNTQMDLFAVMGVAL